MRVMMIAGGSRGDVQPVIALGLGIRAAGHEVTVAASTEYGHMVTDNGLEFHDLGYTLEQFMTSDTGRAWITDSSGRPWRELKHLRAVYAEAAPSFADGLLGLVGSADMFVSSILTQDAVASIAEHDGAQHATALLCPYHPTSDGRAGLTAPTPRVRFTNRNRTAIARWLLTGMLDPIGRRVRARLGMPDGGRRTFLRTVDTIPTVVGVSPTLVPHPKDWSDAVEITGAWQLPTPAGWTPPTDLADFLADGAPPVYLGFGSMSITQPERIREVASAAARAAGVRLLLGSTDLYGADGDDVYGVGDVPHAWLFGRVRAVVHHGGAGTTHAALLAGAPQLAVPHIADQPYWGRRIAEVGIGPTPIPLRRLTEQSLTAALTTLVSDVSFTSRAADLGAVAREERGVEVAVAALGLDRAQDPPSDGP